MAREGLTEKQRRFVEAYAETANATESARRAGYKHATTQGPRLLENVGVRDALRVLSERRTSRAIAAIDECQAILSEMARNETGETEDKDRIAAIDKLLKTHGAYLEKREVKHEGATVQVYLPGNGRDASD